jgi:hypothetical protein
MYCSAVFSAFHFALFLHRHDVFKYYHSLSFSSFYERREYFLNYGELLLELNKLFHLFRFLSLWAVLSRTLVEVRSRREGVKYDQSTCMEMS